MEVWHYCSAVFFILTKWYYHSFIKALVKLQSPSVKFIEMNLFLSLQVPAAQKTPSKLDNLVNLVVSSAGKPFPAGNWKAA